MDADNLMTQKTYLQLLVDIMKKKLEILERLSRITQEQEAIIGADRFDDSRFLDTISEKENLLKQLEELDAGFDQAFERVREELSYNKYRHEAEIRTLQSYIAEITDRSVALQALELRNKSKLEQRLTHMRKEIRNSKLSSQNVVKYYKSMTNRVEEQSYFYDKKK